jgi:hypothetical protein
MGLRPTDSDENPCKYFGGRALAGAGLKPRLQQHRQKVTNLPPLQTTQYSGLKPRLQQHRQKEVGFRPCGGSPDVLAILLDLRRNTRKMGSGSAKTEPTDFASTRKHGSGISADRDRNAIRIFFASTSPDPPTARFRMGKAGPRGPAQTWGSAPLECSPKRLGTLERASSSCRAGESRGRRPLRPTARLTL